MECPVCALRCFDPEYKDGDALPYVIETAKNTVKDYFRRKTALKRPVIVGYYDTVNEAPPEHEEPIDNELAPYEDYIRDLESERPEDTVAAYYETEPEPYEDIATEEEYRRWIAKEDDVTAEEIKVTGLVHNKMGAALYDINYYNPSEREFKKIYGETRQPDYVRKTDKPAYLVLLHYSNYYAKRLFWAARRTHESVRQGIEADLVLGEIIGIYLDFINSSMRYCDVNGNGNISPHRERLEGARLDARGL